MKRLPETGRRRAVVKTRFPTPLEVGRTLGVPAKRVREIEGMLDPPKPCPDARRPPSRMPRVCPRCSARLVGRGFRRRMSWRNSTVNGRRVPEQEFGRLDFLAEPLVSDEGYCEGCLKYVPTRPVELQGSARVRSTFRHARPLWDGEKREWYWLAWKTLV